MNSILGRQMIAVGVICLAVAASNLALRAQGETTNPKEADRRPKLSLKASPNLGVSPANILLSAELTGGANDFQEYYCPTVQWDWADGTQSESSVDCDSYEAGKSEITRRFTTRHTFRTGTHRVWIRLKQSDKIVASASVTVQVQPGLGFENQ
jgi:hypothetical protein